MCFKNGDVAKPRLEPGLFHWRSVPEIEDAKRGPLSDLTYSGGKLSETFARGMLKRSGVVQSAASRIAAYAKPVSIPAIPTSRALPPGMGALAGGVAPTIGVLNVDARSETPSSVLSSIMRPAARQAAREAALIIQRRR
jgi:hypothetical protein